MLGIAVSNARGNGILWAVLVGDVIVNCILAVGLNVVSVVGAVVVAPRRNQSANQIINDNQWYCGRRFTFVVHCSSQT